MAQNQKTIYDLNTWAKQLANVEFDPIVDDIEVTNYNNEGFQELDDMLTASNEHYRKSTFPFSIPTNSNDPATATVELPSDFYKEIAVDLVLANGIRQPIFPMNYAQRYNTTVLRYVLMGSQIRILPPNCAQGSYELLYLSLPDQFALPTVVTVNTASVLPPFVPDNISAGATLPTNNSDQVLAGNPNLFIFAAATITSAMTGSKLVTTGYTNAANNGTHVVVLADPPGHDLQTSGLATNEPAPPGGRTAKVTSSPTQRALWTLKTAALTQDFVGMNVIVSGATFPDNNGVFTIDEVVNEYSFYTTAGPTILGGNFTGTEVISIQQPNTIWKLPLIYQPWYEYIPVRTARMIKSKREQETTDLDNRLALIKQRIESMTTNRKDEGGQVPMTRGLDSTFWQAGPWGILGPGGA